MHPNPASPFLVTVHDVQPPIKHRFSTCAVMQMKTSMELQVESTKVNTSRTVIGSGTRDQREKVYQDAESEKTYFGRLSPGPCAYDTKVHLFTDQFDLLLPAVTNSFGHQRAYQQYHHLRI
jgi:hypothetical protein